MKGLCESLKLVKSKNYERQKIYTKLQKKKIKRIKT